MIVHVRATHKALKGYFTRVMPQILGIESKPEKDRLEIIGEI